MKKFIVSTFVALMTSSMAYAAGFDLPPMPIGNEIGNMQNTNSQMRLMNQQRFRQQEYNDYKEDNLKETRAKRAEQYNKYQEEKQKMNVQNQNIDFVRENGRIMIKSTDK